MVNGELLDRSECEGLKSLKFKGLKFKSQRSTGKLNEEIMNHES